MNARLTLLILVLVYGLDAVGGQPLPGTSPLTWPEDELPDRLMDGAHRFVERQIERSVDRRRTRWPNVDASNEQWNKAVTEHRERLKTIIGAVDVRLPPQIEYFGGTPKRTVVSPQESCSVSQVRWPVLEGVWGEGLYVAPKQPVAAVVLVPDADQTPEQLLGMTDGIPSESQIARRLIANNVAVLIPVLVSRNKLETNDPRLKQSDQTQREWLTTNQPAIFELLKNINTLIDASDDAGGVHW